MINSYEKVLESLLKFLLVVWGVVCVVSFCLITYYFSNNYIYIIPASLIGGIIGVFTSSYFYVIFMLPFMLQKEFDTIKNKLALNNYTSVDTFQLDISEFVFSFFRFPGLTIESGMFHFKNADVLKCNMEGISFKDINLKSRDFNIYKLKKNRKAIYIPIRIDKFDLGYMLLITSKYSLPFLPDVISNFENHYLDDQLLHLMHKMNHIN